MRRIMLAIVASACAWFALPGQARTAGTPALYRQSRRLMGTLCAVQVYSDDGGAARRAMAEALEEMARVDRLLSNYLPDSELSRMNATAATRPFPASSELYAFVTRARALFDETKGTFDPTVGAIVRAWGFFTATPGRPAPADVVAARARAGFAHVATDDRARTVAYDVDGLEFDPGGIGKGYAADRAAAVLRERGVSSALVDAGGSTLVAVGAPPDAAGWTIAIRHPARPAESIATAVLRDNALSTSGVSERFVVDGGRRYAHIIDPRSGEPSEGMCQVTVVAPDATTSDALTKAAFLLSRAELADLRAYRSGAHMLRIEGACADGVVWETPWSAGIFVR